MKKIDDGVNKPILSWCENIEESAMEQINHLKCLPFLHQHVAIMPDCHAGYGMPIGGVIATKGVIIPNAVGKDIGCGMHAVKLNLQKGALTQDSLKKILGNIRELIPVGFKHREPVDLCAMPNHTQVTVDTPIVDEQFENARTQLGTLGGGK